MTLNKAMKTLNIEGDKPADATKPGKSKSLGSSKQHSPSSSDSALNLGNSTSTLSSTESATIPVPEVMAQIPVATVAAPKYSRRQRRKSSNANKAYDSANSSPTAAIHANTDMQAFIADTAIHSANQNPNVEAVDELDSVNRGRKFSGTIAPGDMIFYADDDFTAFNSSAGLQKKFKPHSTKTDRKRRSQVSLSITKNGGGGKFTWGRPGDEWKTHCPSGVKDSHDPNFDEFIEDKETYFTHYRKNYTDADICEALHGSFKEYLENGDDREALDVIVVMQSNQININVISRIFFHLFLWGLEAKKVHRGHVWSLNCKILARKEIKHGHESLLNALSAFFDSRTEVSIDCPDYDEYLQKLMACFLYKFYKQEEAVFFERFIDEQIKKRRRTSFTEMMKVVRSIARRLKSESEIMQTLWTVDDYLTTEELTLALSRLVDDWESCGYGHISLGDDLSSNFKTPHFYHQLVYLLLMKAINNGGHECMNYLVQTLQYLVQDRDLITLSQVKMGFGRVYREMDRLAVDIPAVHMLMGMIVKLCYREKLIDDETRVKVPKKKLDRRRIRSEMCHSKF